MPYEVKAALNRLNRKDRDVEYENHDDSGEEAVMENGNAEKDENIHNNLYEYIVESANREAVRIVDEAKAIADSMISEAQRKAGDIAKESEKKGKEKGYDEGIKNAKAEYQSILDEAQCKKKEAYTEYNRILESIRDDMAQLVIKAVKRVVGEELKTGKEVILSMIRESISKCSNRDMLVIKVSPDDYDYVTENEHRIKALAEGAGELDIVSDPSLDSCSCIVETPCGYIDSGIKTRINKLEKVVKQQVMARSAEYTDDKK